MKCYVCDLSTYKSMEFGKRIQHIETVEENDASGTHVVGTETWLKELKVKLARFVYR